MNRKLAIIPAIIVIAIFINFYNADVAKKYKEPTDSRPTINILFIGNSYTFYNNMPKLLESIALSQDSSPYKIRTEMVTLGGATLKQHWNGKKAQKAIKDNSWQYVVLQEQSTAALLKDMSRDSYIYARYFHDLITQSGAKTIFYATWPRKPGNIVYDTFPQGYNYMKGIVNNHYYRMAKDFGASLVYTSDAWDIGQHYHIPMYVDDGSHPSIYGSYFVALKFYRHLLPDVRLDTGSLYTPSGIDEANVKHVLEAMQR